MCDLQFCILQVSKNVVARCPPVLVHPSYVHPPGKVAHMPRRNTKARNRTKPRPTSPPEEEQRPSTPDAMAHRLVSRGLASRQILIGTPKPTTGRNTTR